MAASIARSGLIVNRAVEYGEPSRSGPIAGPAPVPPRNVQYFS
jgi:hypothetical protein